MNKKLALLARPDHSVQLFKKIPLFCDNQNSVFVTFNIKKEGGLFGKFFIKGKTLPKGVRHLVLFTLYNQLSRKFKVLNRFENLVASVNCSFNINEPNLKIIHYWPIYFSSFVKKYKEKNNTVIAIADVYEANYSIVKSIYSAAYHTNGFQYTSKAGKEDREKELYLSDVILVPSEFVKKTYEERINKTFKVIDYGLLGQRVVKTNNTYDKKKLNLLFIGNASIEKGFDLILKLDLAELGITISSIGGISLEVKALFDINNTPVNFLGALSHDQVQLEIEKFDALILPSYADAFSMAVIEALLKQKPVIVSSNCGNSDIIKSWGLGEVFMSGDICSLSQGVKQLKNNYEVYRGNILKYDIYEGNNPYHQRVMDVYREFGLND